MTEQKFDFEAYRTALDAAKKGQLEDLATTLTAIEKEFIRLAGLAKTDNTRVGEAAYKNALFGFLDEIRNLHSEDAQNLKQEVVALALMIFYGLSLYYVGEDEETLIAGQKFKEDKARIGDLDFLENRDLTLNISGINQPLFQAVLFFKMANS